MGDKGPPGSKGEVGAKGMKGQEGTKGMKGNTGDQGKSYFKIFFFEGHCRIIKYHNSVINQCVRFSDFFGGKVLFNLRKQ